MKHIDDIFSDHFTQKNNFLTRIDARLKIVFTITAILLTLCSQKVWAPWWVIVSVLITLLSIKIPVKILIHRLCAPLGIALTFFIIKLFYHELNFQYAIIPKIISCAALVLFLSMTTPVPKLLSAARWFKAPQIWIEVCLLTYRYIFVLLEDAKTVFDAQRVRLGYSAINKSLRSLGVLAGAIVIKAYDQSAATYDAMTLRGYKNMNTDSTVNTKLKKTDIAAIFIFAIILLAIV